jgi:hypothetical protein
MLFKIIILPLVLYDSEIWSLTLTEKKNRLRVCEGGMMKEIFGCKREEIWRK